MSKKNYSFYLKYEKYNFLSKLWKYKNNINIIKQFNKYTKKEMSYKYWPRFLEKKKFINKFYFLPSIYKELLIFYKIKLNGDNKNILNEYEKSFLPTGPLNYYHIKTNNINNIKNGIIILSNCIFKSKKKYPTLFALSTNYFTKIFSFLFFLPLKKIYLKKDQFKNVLFYKQWIFKTII